MDIKGTKDGILVTLQSQDWQEAKRNVIEQIQGKQEFFRGACLVLDVGHLVLGANELEELRDILSEYSVDLTGVLSESIVTQQTAKLLGLKTKIAKTRAKSDNNIKPLDTVFAGEPAVLLHRTMRSGFKVAYQGHVIVLGDVNPGAEIIASGSVIVWGRLRGMVHAGADGDDSAVVCALDLSPMQLRIASKIATTPQDVENSQPEIASIKDDQIIAEPWHH